jgi:outer membrane receptor for ferrienterochelin and colicins
MSSSRWFDSSRRALGTALRAIAVACAVLAIVMPGVLGAQGRTGRLSGIVRDSARTPVAGAQVQVVGTRFGALTDDAGRFRIVGVPSGAYTVRVQRIGMKASDVTSVNVAADQEATIEVTLSGSAVQLGGVTVSASRRVEKVTEAPATVTSFSAQQLDATVGNTFAAALKEAKGIDFIQTGMTSIAINARGFNSSFNNRFLMVEDGRISVLPENGLPVGSFTPTPKVDLAGMEVLVGPGSALYGPDASSGVLSLRTKDPKQFPGATLEVAGGSRSYADVQGRYAGVVSDGRFGYKVSGEYQRANDWENFLYYNAGGSVVSPTAAGTKVLESALRNPISWDSKVMRGSAAGVWYQGDNRLEVNGGMSVTDGVGQTNVGRNQLDGWTYNTLQARYTTPHWYLNAYRSQSQSGDSYALNRYAGAQLSNANNTAIDADSLRMLSDWPSNGRMYAAEVQGNYKVPMLLNTNTIFGAQWRDDVVSSKRQWLTDRITGEDISNDQTGVYAQTTTPVMPWLDVVLAGRYDKPSQYDAQWSPKAGVVVKPIADQAFRVTFNRAYKSPTILQTNFFIPDWTSSIAIYGNTGGFETVDANGNVVPGSRKGPMQPETNKTWEYGYKGIFFDRLFVDATYFKSDYTNFMSPLTVIGNPFAAGAAQTFAKPLTNPGNNIPVDAQGRIRTPNPASPALANPIVLIYYNLGDAKVSGTDLGLNYYLLRNVELRGTLSTVKIDALEVPKVNGTPVAGSQEAASLNSPTTKYTLGATVKDLGPVTAGVTSRNVQSYYFRSGSNSGIIPRFNSVDANLSYRVPVLENVLVNLSVANLFGCTKTNAVYSTPTGAQPNSKLESVEHKCGFGRKHKEMINMPEIGTMAFLGVRFQR